MIDRFTRTRFRSAYQLETWYPVGLLDGAMVAFFASYIGFEESIADEPFNRYADLSRLTAIHLDFIELIDLAATRRAAYHEGPPVKSAFFRARQGGLWRGPHVRGADGAVVNRGEGLPHGRGCGAVVGGAGGDPARGAITE